MPHRVILTELGNLAPGDIFAWRSEYDAPLCYVEPCFKPPGLVPWQLAGLPPRGEVYAKASLRVYFLPDTKGRRD